MAEPIQLSNFPDLSVEDTVSLQIAGGVPGSVEQTAPDVTWWKALEVRSLSGGVLAQVETQDADHGPKVISVQATDLPGARLVLAKAKAFGIHTGMYELRSLDAQLGQSLQFLWQRDDHRDGPVAGFFRTLGGGIMQAADAVAGAVETVVNVVAEVVSDIVETVGTFLRNVLDAVGTFLGGIPIIGPAIKAVFHWLGTFVSAIFDFVATWWKAGVELLAGIVAGVIRVVGGAIGGLLAWDGRLLVKGVGDIVSSIAGGLLVFVGKFLGYLAAVLTMQFGERALTRAERDILRQVYRGSVALYNVRIVDTIGVGGIPSPVNIAPRSFTLGNTIYMRKDPAKADYLETLVHECCHVWQYQNLGPRYTTDAIWAQLTVKPDAYTWQDELPRGNLRWQDFNKEAQAKFLEDVWVDGRLKAPPKTAGNGIFYKDDPIGSDVEFRVGKVDFTSLAIESIAYVRGAFAWRISRLLDLT